MNNEERVQACAECFYSKNNGYAILCDHPSSKYKGLIIDDVAEYDEWGNCKGLAGLRQSARAYRED